MVDKVMICLVGGQTEPNVMAATEYDLAAVLLVYTADTEKQGQVASLRDSFHNLGITVAECCVEPHNLRQIEDQINKEIKKQSWDGGQLIFNLTGGTKMMAFAALNAAQALDAVGGIIYVNSQVTPPQCDSYQLAKGRLVHSSMTQLTSLNKKNKESLLNFFLRVHGLTEVRPDVQYSCGHEFELQVATVLEEAFVDRTNKQELAIYRDVYVQAPGMTGHINIDVLLITDTLRVVALFLKTGKGAGGREPINEAVGNTRVLGRYTKICVVSDREPNKPIDVDDVKNYAQQVGVNRLVLKSFDCRPVQVKGQPEGADIKGSISSGSDDAKLLCLFISSLLGQENAST